MSTWVPFQLKWPGIEEKDRMTKAKRKNVAKIRPDGDEPEPEPKWLGRTEADEEVPDDDDDEDSSNLYEADEDPYNVGDEEEGGEAETGQEGAA